MTNSIQQTVIFNASPAQIYSMLMDEKRHEAFTESSARIDNHENGTFEVWDGYISGKNIILIPNLKIVQEWTAADMPEGHVSLLTIILTSLSDNKTELKMLHENVPENQVDDFAKGWEDFYWTPMKAYLQMNLLS